MLIIWACFLGEGWGPLGLQEAGNPVEGNYPEGKPQEGNLSEASYPVGNLAVCKGAYCSSNVAEVETVWESLPAEVLPRRDRPVTYGSCPCVQTM